jgi:peptidoglycan/xylan/chitin deacetylase (PgdA/CDA1 family)
MNTLMRRTVSLDEAAFVISLDTELAWGAFDRNGVQRYAKYYAQVRYIVGQLLGMFEEHHIKATWAMVGHLFLSSCSRNGANNHNHVLQPNYRWYPQGWLSHDPYSHVDAAPYFYAPDVVDSIVSSRQRHELASHTFTHVILGDPDCSEEVASSQLQECQRLAQATGREMVSLVFPRNQVGHLAVLCRLGFTSFRGPEQNWYGEATSRGRSRKIMRFVDKFLGTTPPCYNEFLCYRENYDQRWLVNLPASMFFPPYSGLWTLVGISKRVSQAKKGIAEAIRNKALFHLWFHPFNLATSPRLLDALSEVLAEVDRQVKAGSMKSLTMAETALHLTSHPE